MLTSTVSSITFGKFDSQKHLGPCPPNTWDFLTPTKEFPNNLLVLVCGNRHPNRIQDITHKIDEKGNLHPAFRCSQCSFNAQVQLDGFRDKRPLFSVIRTLRRTGKLLPPMYLHATDIANARFIYLNGDPGRLTNIIIIGQVVGYHVLDEHGERLIA